MTYINILNEDIKVECLKQGNKYNYFICEHDESPYNIGTSEKSPLELSKLTQIGKQIFEKIQDNITLSQSKTMDLNKEFRLIMEQLEKDIHIQEKQLEKESKKEIESLEVEYEELYAEFISNCKKYNYTPLQYITRIFEGCGVNAELQMVKSFSGYLQTFLGLKGTNVIGVGSQSSGKTHCLEQALDCIPDEFVHKGTFTVASFFQMYAGKDLTGHLFYLGDLGGIYDDNKTIESRDILKQLSTDGYVSRSLVDDEDGAINESVRGNPAISYTTADETIINEQERSRSSIIQPPEVDHQRLMVFDSFQESPGQLYTLKNQIEQDKKTIKGYVWWLKKNINTIEMFNPFMFCTAKYLENVPDFNRKIKEFNMLLKIVCILNNSYRLTHTIYCDYTKETIEEMEITTTLLIPSKQDIIDALTLFEGNSGLLPSEVGLAKALIKLYDIYPEYEIPINDIHCTLNDDATLEEIIQYNAIENPTTAVMEKVNSDDSKSTYLEGYHDGLLFNNEPLHCFFTISDVKKGNTNQRWYREVKNDLSRKLYKLYNYGILIKLGKNEYNENVYCLSPDVNDKISGINPVFSKKDIDKAMDIFHEKYPELVEEYNVFISKQKQLQLKKTNFEIQGDHLYDLQWNKIKA